jgi:hypothetical protein
VTKRTRRQLRINKSKEKNKKKVRAQEQFAQAQAKFAQWQLYQECGDDNIDKNTKCPECIEHGYYCPGKDKPHSQGDYGPTME